MISDLFPHLFVPSFLPWPFGSFEATFRNKGQSLFFLGEHGELAVDPFIHFLVTAAISLSLALLPFLFFRRPPKSHPDLPGPVQIPLIGRIHDLPLQYTWLKFKEWADTYGPIYRTSMFGANFVVISDEKMAEDLLVKRAKIYSDRPMIQSLFDSKSTHGSMEYLPLMGKNSTQSLHHTLARAQSLLEYRILVSTAPVDPCCSSSGDQYTVLWHYPVWSEEMALQSHWEPRRILFLRGGHGVQDYVYFDLGRSKR
jgi:hypothetical protein